MCLEVKLTWMTPILHYLKIGKLPLKQFNSQNFMEFYSSLEIKQQFTLMEQPQSNGQVELANRILLGGLKKQLNKAKGRSAKELPSVLWSYRTTPQMAIQETPFKLMYRCEAMIPVEVG